MSNTPTTITPTRIQIKHDTAANWKTKNPVLAAGEMGYDETKKITKVGNGVTPWNDLDCFATKPDLPLTVSLATDSIDTIIEVSNAIKSGKATLDDFNYKIGDRRNITFSNNETITVRLGGVLHDDLADGSGKAGLTFIMENLLATTYPMNSSNTNSGGWENSKMRTQTMPTLFSQLPQEWQNAIKQVHKKATAGSQSTTITTSTDKLFLLSLAEICSHSAITNSSSSAISGKAATYNAEGEQYALYAQTNGDTDPNSASNALIKKLSNGTGSANWWWLRSPNLGSSSHFRYVGTDGTANSNYSASSSNGVCFGFCI